MRRVVAVLLGHLPREGAGAAARRKVKVCWVIAKGEAYRTFAIVHGFVPNNKAGSFLA
jgi:hypothetical protein